LQAKGGGAEIKGFVVAGADKKFVHAKAVADGKSVEVGADGIEYPRHVRYAWDDYPECDLTDEIGLPCGPFEMSAE